LKKRLEMYHSQTAPLVSYYSKKGLHTAIDAKLESSVVFNNVVSAIENLKKRVCA
jgi:adenylate kinase